MEMEGDIFKKTPRNTQKYPRDRMLNHIHLLETAAVVSSLSVPKLVLLATN